MLKTRIKIYGGGFAVRSLILVACPSMAFATSKMILKASSALPPHLDPSGHRFDVNAHSFARFKVLCYINSAEKAEMTAISGSTIC